MQTHMGEIFALLVAFCYMVNAIAYESAGKSVGSLSVSYIRIFIAFPLLAISSFISRGLALPTDATGHTWFWLLISGFLGFVLGDIFLFASLVELGSRISLLIMSAAPPITAIASYLILGEKISLLGLIGMAMTMAGISLVILSRNPEGNKISFNRPIKGIIYASLGAVGQALGLVFGKLGMGNYNAFASTQVRLIAAFIGYTIIITAGKKWPEIKGAFEEKKAIKQIAIGSVFGPFIGVALSLAALQHAPAGIVSSISSIAPVIIIPVSIMVFKEKILSREILGALVSIAGVVLLFL